MRVAGLVSDNERQSYMKPCSVYACIIETVINIYGASRRVASQAQFLTTITIIVIRRV